MKNIFLFLFLFIISGSAFAGLPENDLFLQDKDAHFNNTITEEDFIESMNEVIEVYSPIINKLGGKLIIQGDWEDSTVNAWTKKDGKDWVVQMFGGLARRKEITKDAFKLVICHEIAHHIGGYPTSGWASIEGQADYVTTFVCAKKLFANTKDIDNNYERCNVYESKKDANICSRTLEAGQSLANLLSAISFNKIPNYSTPDKTEVKKTSGAHPKAQCRLDTFLAGAICKKEWNDRTIPKNAEATCDNRPKCWFYK